MPDLDFSQFGQNNHHENHEVGDKVEKETETTGSGIDTELKWD